MSDADIRATTTDYALSHVSLKPRADYLHVIEKSAYDFQNELAELHRAESDARGKRIAELEAELDNKRGAMTLEIHRLSKQVEAAGAENSKLKAENWVLKDNSLRTYDGLAQKAKMADELLKQRDEALAWCERLAELLSRQLADKIHVDQLKGALAEYSAWKGEK